MPREIEKIVTSVRESRDIQSRKSHIRELYKALRRADRFSPTWEAFGGAKGLAALLADFSLFDVKLLCRYLGRTASAQGARDERQVALAELVRLLTAPDALDPRPLKSIYQRIVPACTEELINEWERAGVSWEAIEQKMLANAHPQRFKDTFLEQAFSPKVADTGLWRPAKMFFGNWQFIDEILLHLIETEGEVKIPSSFMANFVMSFVRGSLRSRYDDAFRIALFDKVVKCVEKYESLAKQLNFNVLGLFDIIVMQWKKQVDRRKDFEPLAGRLISVMPRATELSNIRRMLERVGISLSYGFLRLVFKHAKRYEIDIDDGSDDGIVNLQKLEKYKWPADFFTRSIDSVSSMGLFQRLMKAFPDVSFLLPAPSSMSTVLRQTRSPIDDGGDPEVLRCRLILLSDDPPKDYGTGWHAKVEALVQERQKKAAQGRDSLTRAFWAKSALRLCIAAELRELYGDTLRWARRFNNDVLAAKQLYSDEIVMTDEGKELLSGFPGRGISDLTTTKASVESANQILIDFLETAAMAVNESSFQRSDWASNFRIHNLIIEYRLKQVSALETRLKVTQSQTFEVIWKPTIDMLLKTENFRVKPEHSALQPQILRDTAASVGRSLACTFDAALQADLLSYVVEAMKRDLEPVYVRRHTGDVVFIVKRIATGGQPTLASPFVRDLVVDGHDNSAWHRELINVRFLSHLPARATRAFLQDITDTLRERLREQNARRRQPKEVAAESASEPTSPLPYVKVTTVKMLAQVLKDVQYIDKPTACDMLIGLLSHARHIDIHVAVLDSLLPAISEPETPDELRTKIIDGLEAHTVSVAAQISERNPATEDDWAAAAASGEASLPDVSETTSALFGLLLSQQKRLGSLHENDKARLARLVMSVLEQSAANNARWMELFLRKHKFSLGPNETLPMAPVRIEMIVNALGDCVEYMPRSAFDMIKKIVLTNLSPPDSIAKITKAVKGDPELVHSNAGKHWLSQFDNDGSAALRLGVGKSIYLLHAFGDRVKPKIEDGITVGMLQDFILEVVDVLVTLNDAKLIEALVSELNTDMYINHSSDAREYHNWKKHCIPILGEIIRRVENTKPTRHSKASPNPFRLRTIILHAPFYHRGLRYTAAEIDIYIAELSDLIDRLAARRLPYHADWAVLSRAAVGTPRASMDYAQHAVQLGSLDDVDLANPTLGDYLRVELAGELLIAATEPRGQGIVGAARELVKTWMECEVEGFRATGSKAFDELGNRDKDSTRGWFIK